MNENLMRLKALVKETNQVIANLKSEVLAIEDANQIMRAKRFEQIKENLLECQGIVKELGVSISIPIKSNVRYLHYPTTTFMKLNHKTSERIKPITFSYKYINSKGYECSDSSSCSDEGIDSETTWKTNANAKQYFFGCCWNEADEKAFVDNWDQDDFEKKFAAEIDRVVTEKANKANAEYNYVTHNTELLREDKT